MRAFLKRWTKRGAVTGGVLGAAYVADLAANEDLDDFTYVPMALYNHYFGAPHVRKKVVVLGSGWGAMSFLRKIDPSLYDITIVSPRPFFFYTPMLAGVPVGTVKGSSIVEPVRETHPMPDANFVRGACSGVDFDKKKVKCEDTNGSMELSYDHLVISVGTQPNTFGIPGVQENAFFLKELEHGMALRRHVSDTLECAANASIAGRKDQMSNLLSFVIVGGGPTGVEFAAELSDFVKTEVAKCFPQLSSSVKLTLVEALPQVLNVFDRAIGDNVNHHLTNQGVRVLTNTAVKKVEKGVVTYGKKGEEPETLPYGTLVWVAGIGARPITNMMRSAIGEAQNDRRGLVVDGCLRVKGTRENEVFAIGDCAFSGYAPTAQVAAQQGKYLGRVFRDLAVTPTENFSYSHKGTMAYVGEGSAAYQLKTKAPDYYFFRALYGTNDVDVSTLGPAGFAVWRSVYFTKLFSIRNRFNVTGDWLRCIIFGRPIASATQTSTHVTA
jgi:NADH:ubiquinone reductase (non-electrogenic)